MHPTSKYTSQDKCRHAGGGMHPPSHQQRHQPRPVQACRWRDGGEGMHSKAEGRDGLKTGAAVILACLCMCIALLLHRQILSCRSQTLKLMPWSLPSHLQRILLCGLNLHGSTVQQCNATCNQSAATSISPSVPAQLLICWTDIHKRCT
jgi:hypothetical protein